MAEPSTREPLVSIVVPFYDSGRHLGACIEALLALDVAPGEVELILVDNASTDDSATIAAGFRGITVLHEATPGAYAARNTGVRVARAPIIAFTDADCTVDRDWARAILASMADPETGAVIGQCRYPKDASSTLRVLGAWENAKAAHVTRRCPPANRFAYCNNMAVRASLFDEIGLFREWRRAADSELVHRMAAERPELELRYDPAMRITHHEFTRARDRARRLRLYTETNTQIDGFCELTALQRLRVLASWLLGAGR
ncbi:MAG: glycosyltransferase family 2 protein [Thermoanaerobaculales bacterium]|jgi:glycosyltransferase involved in cell wall biosynthesis|nr:glycosyltransferase family 2 protein [Thermoanaerobaculales bacterium]